MKHLRNIFLAAAVILYAPYAIAKGWHYNSQPEMDCFQQTCSDDTIKQQQEHYTAACVKEAKQANGSTTWTRLINGIKHKLDPEAEEMKQLCQEMAAEYPSQDKDKRTFLAQQCGDHIKEEVEKGPRNLPHFKHLKNICEKMTGQKIEVNYDKETPQPVK